MCGLFGGKSATGLIEDFGDVMRMLLAMTGGMCLLLLVSSVCFLKGVGCNFLVCIAVWMSLAAQSVPGKLAAMYLPIFTFVLCGFEHSVANMFYLPAGILAAGRYGVAAEGLSWASMWTGNLLPVTLGNILGGCLVGVVYWAVYLRRGRRA